MTATVELAAPPTCLWVPPGRVGSYADDVAEVAENLGRPLLPEQWVAVDALTAHDARGRFLSIEAGVEMPRQNGKSGAILLPIILWSALTDPDHFVWTAHLLDTSNKAFADLAGKADDDQGLIRNCDWLRRRVRPPSYENGAEGISFVNGAQLDFRARSGRRGRGLSGNTVVVDEALFFTGEQAGALLPILSTRSLHGNARAYYGSSAAKAGSDHLRSLRARALRRDPTLIYAGWWAPGSWAEPGCEMADCAHTPGVRGCTLDDEDLWAGANLMLDRMTSRDFLRTMRNTLANDPMEFGREFLGWEEPADGADSVPINPKRWSAMKDLLSRRAEGSTVGMGIDVARDRSAAAISWCGRRTDGLLHWEVVRHARGMGWVPGAVADLAAKMPLGWVEVKPGDVRPAIAGDALALKPLLPALQAVGVDPVLLGASDIAAACTGVVDDVDEDRARHIGQEQLDRAVEGAVRRFVGDGGMAFGKRASAVDVTPLYGVAAARWVFLAADGRGDPLSQIW